VAGYDHPNLISGVVGSKARASRWLAIAPRLGFGRRSYRRRLAGVAGDLALATHVLFERASVHQIRLRAQLLRLDPPESLRAEHAQLLALLAEADRRWTDARLPPQARARDAVGLLRQARAQRERLEQRARAAGGERYARALADLAKRALRQLDHTIAGTEQAGIAALGRLSRTRPPAGAALFQWALVDVLGQHLSAMKSFHSAYRALDPPRVQAAARELERTAAAVQPPREALEALLIRGGPSR
jgi:hypothetical protein